MVAILWYYPILLSFVRIDCTSCSSSSWSHNARRSRRWINIENGISRNIREIRRDGLITVSLLRGGEGNNDMEEEQKGKNELMLMDVITAAEEDDEVDMIVTNIEDEEFLSYAANNDDYSSIKSHMLEILNNHLATNTKVKKLLHILAPKIPAICKSPDYLMKITWASPSDSNLAAYAIGLIAEYYHKAADEDMSCRKLFRDRRMEQLIECVLCGIGDSLTDEEEDYCDDTTYIQHLRSRARDALGIERQRTTGVDHVMDACRAAWGLTLLGLISKEEPTLISREWWPESILTMLADRCYRLILISWYHRTSEEKQQRHLSKDVAFAMWAFACVKACTNVVTPKLFQFCCFVLLDTYKEEESFVDEVVHRLAISEQCDSLEDDTEPHYSQQPHNTTTANTTLIDFLSSKELTNVIWALAIQSNHSSSSQYPQRLTKLVSQQIIRHLEQDLLLLSSPTSDHSNATADPNQDFANETMEANPKEKESYPTSIHQLTQPEEKENEEEIMVVDAAALLASDDASNIEREILSTSTPSSPSSSGNGTAVAIVDSAALFSKKIQQHFQNFGGSTTLLSNISAHDSTHEIKQDENNTYYFSQEQHTSSKRRTHDLESSPNATISAEPQPTNTTSAPKLFFSPHDLTSISWALTELRTPSSYPFLNMTLHYFTFWNKDALGELNGMDLSNLLWSIAKWNANEFDTEIKLSSCMEKPYIEKFLFRTTCLSLDILKKHPMNPLELSRLMWSLVLLCRSHCGSNTMHGGSDDYYTSVFQDIAIKSIDLVFVHYPMYRIEDLARILWAFVELTHLGQPQQRHLLSSLTPQTLLTLARMQMAIESSLLHWEKTRRSTPIEEETKGEHYDVVSPPPLFGRSRLSFPDISLEEEKEFMSELPSLRSLPLDPSTLCKVAYACALVSQPNQQRQLEGTIRISARILSSNRGRLLAECHIRDIVRLTYACAKTMSFGGIASSGTREAIKHFVRRVVQLLNDDWDEVKESKSYKGLMEMLSPHDLATLLWSLGELGVHCDDNGSTAPSGSKKMKLVAEKPVLSEEQLKELSTPSLLDLFHGVVSLCDISNDEILLLQITSEIQRRMQTFSPESYCQTLTSSAHLYHFSISARNEIPEKEQQQQPQEQRKDIHSAVDALFKISNDALLQLMETLPCRSLSSFTALQLRKLLNACIHAPFQADTFVDAIRREVEDRIEALTAAASTVSFSDSKTNGGSGTTGVGSSNNIPSLIRRAAECTVDAAAMLSNLKASLKSTSKKSELDLFLNVTDATDQVNRATAAACEVAALVERVGRGISINIDDVVRYVEEETLWELGRCVELLDSYRRLEFHRTGNAGMSSSHFYETFGKNFFSRLFQ